MDRRPRSLVRRMSHRCRDDCELCSDSCKHLGSRNEMVSSIAVVWSLGGVCLPAICLHVGDGGQKKIGEHWRSRSSGTQRSTWLFCRSTSLTSRLFLDRFHLAEFRSTWWTQSINYGAFRLCPPIDGKQIENQCLFDRSIRFLTGVAYNPWFKCCRVEILIVEELFSRPVVALVIILTSTKGSR